ncbi:MAG: hypothetical protein P1V51_19700 [Deltaproteobacteria bacterium]|nr:hypothetical protein [Deltaproteobacteria bacterium]
MRARRDGDIQRAFPDCLPDVFTDEEADYFYRALISKKVVAAELSKQIMGIDYDNFKDSVSDRELHDAYVDIWWRMLWLQADRLGLANRPTLPFTRS